MVPRNVTRTQTVNLCGPTALSISLSMMGREVSPISLAPVSAFWRGIDEFGLSKMASKNGVESSFLAVFRKIDRWKFYRLLKDHVSKWPAILLVWNFRHWISVIGLEGNKLVIRDPRLSGFKFWDGSMLYQEAWCEPDDDNDEPAQMFAILLKPKDQVRAFTPDRRFRQLVTR